MTSELRELAAQMLAEAAEVRRERAPRKGARLAAPRIADGLSALTQEELARLISDGHIASEVSEALRALDSAPTELQPALIRVTLRLNEAIARRVHALGRTWELTSAEARGRACALTTSASSLTAIADKLASDSLIAASSPAPSPSPT